MVQSNDTFGDLIFLYVAGEYRIAGKFGGKKVWQIWRIVCDSPN